MDGTLFHDWPDQPRIDDPRPMIIDSFAGGGGASTGIEMALGRSPDVAINHNPAALALHEANHPHTLHLINSIYAVDPDDVCHGRHVGLAWFSPDCFPAGTMILTDRGYRPIEAIVEGDRVLTHAGRYRRVYATMRAEKAICQIDVQGVPTITVSDEHPFYARAMHNVWDNTNRRYRRNLAPAAWVLAKDLRAGAAPMNAAGGDRHFCATPCSFEHIAIPKVGGRGIALDERLMWLAGRYVGDGWTRLGDGRAELVITCGKLEADGLAERLAIWPRSGERAASSELAWHRRDTKTAHQFSTNHRGLVEWLRDEFGHGGAEKSFPAWALSASESLRRALLAGYVSADGSEFSTGANHITETVTISKALALSTKALAESLGLTATISQPRKNTAVIDGRTVNAKPTYMVRWREAPARSQTVRDDLHNWSRVQGVGVSGDMVEVFNISVEDDETYIADGIVVHNCKHFSKAKGGKPVEKGIRDLAWVVVHWAKRVRPDVIMLENVEEFEDWCPLTDDHMPDTTRKGETFTKWAKALRRLGYKIQWRVLRACDYGAPTIRKRLFVIARRDGRDIVWPKPTHFPTPELLRDGFGNPDDAKYQPKPYRTAAECIDWSLPCPSIFDSAAEIKKKFGLRANRPLADNTLSRVARGMKRYVLEADDPFLVNTTVPSLMSLKGTARRDSPINAPHPTVLAGGGHSAMIAPVLTYAQQGGACRDISDPHHTICANSKDQNSVIIPTMIQTGYGERKGQAPRALDITAPLGTVVAGGIKHATAAAFLAQQNGGPKMANHAGRDPRDPMSTITAAGSQQTPVAAFFAKYYGTGDGARHDEPMHTVTVKDRFAHTQAELSVPPFSPEHEARAREVAEFLRSHGAWDGGEFVTLTIDGCEYVIVDIGLRMLTPRELFNAQGFPPDYVIEGVWHQGGDTWTFKTFPKNVQISCVGNSVAPDIAAALVSANCAHLIEKEMAA